MTRVGACAILMLVVAASVVQADYQITGVTLVPQQFYVGDRVEMRVTLRIRSGVELTVPDTIPHVEWGEIHQIHLASRGQDWDVRIALTSYQPGTRTIPPLDLGAILVPDLSIHIPSILGSVPSELSAPQPQLMPPGTRILVSLLLVAMLLLPVGWIVFLRWGRRHFIALIERYRERKPYRRLARAIKTLGDDVETMDGRSFYIALLESVRRYVSNKLQTDCMSATTGEMGSYLERLMPDAVLRRQILDLFRYGDLVKFASGPAPVDQRREHLVTLQTVIETLERGERKRSNARTPSQRRSRVAI